MQQTTNFEYTNTCCFFYILKEYPLRKISFGGVEQGQIVRKRNFYHCENTIKSSTNFCSFFYLHVCNIECELVRTVCENCCILKMDKKTFQEIRAKISN